MPDEEHRNCPACGEEILATARKCKHCHEWLDGSLHPEATQEQNVVTVEQTGKGWKAAKLTAVVLVVVGIAVVGSDPEGEMAMAGSLAFVGGLLLLLVAIVGAWWCHG